MWCAVIANGHKCVLNPYYQPVCGNDMKTYPNKDILDCFNRQRPRSRQIRIIYHRECHPLVCPSFVDLQGPWPIQSPVCASNGFTYGHIHQVRCLRDLLPDIRVLHEGGCTLHETYRALGRNAHVKACSSPRRMFEKNSICTSNNQTYENPFVTICLAGNFMHVREKIGGACGNPTQRSCEKVTKIHESLKSASINERTKFLACGSDLRTYRSEHHLECSRPYNRYLSLTHFGRCVDFNGICPEKLKYVQTAAPVCGTDGHSYITFEALLCARYRMNKNLNYLHSGACI